MKKIQSIADLKQIRDTIIKEKNQKKHILSICSGTGCHAYGSETIVRTFEEEIKQKNLENVVEIKRTGCHGFCEKGPIVVILPEDICYVQVKIDDIKEIITETLLKGKIIDRLLFKDKKAVKTIVRESDIPFYKHQSRIIFGNNGIIESKDIRDYIALDGYQALAKALLEMTSDAVLEEVKQSNLRGRGGGGFPTGRKWESVRNAKGEKKFVIVNCDEGDPGAYMDRSLMEGNPHSVIEGLIIGAFAIGSNEGYIYVRQEYPLAVKNTELAIKQAEECGLLGKNILGSGFDFSIKIHQGAGAFVSGESSALMSAIEGNVGEPKPKYIHTSEKGLWDMPTCLNNVETWANIPFIINKGSTWFNGIGTENSKGTKIFSLVGNVNNTGLVEVPMGTTLRKIIYDIGGGIPNGKQFKAVQTGGPSGGVIPESLLDLPVDFDELSKAGSMMGSGGMIVMDEDTCMVDIARYYINFLSEESCGKCTPCREGLRHMLRILNTVSLGTATHEDITLLEELATVIQDSALCALGQTAPNPVLSTLKHFREEYEAHINGECPSKVCKNLISYAIDPETCKGCGLCATNCPSHAISGQKKGVYRIDHEKCITCGICFDVCTFKAVLKQSKKIPKMEGEK